MSKQEDYILESISHNVSHSEGLFKNEPLLNDLLEKRKIFLKKHRPNEKDFKDIYSEEEIEKDLKEINIYKENWKKEEAGETAYERYVRKISHLYEVLLADQIKMNNWLGGNCETFVTSEYDDVKNGMDVGVIFKTKEKKHLGFSVDATFSSDEKVLHDKLDSVKGCIRSGSLPTLKYFQDPETGEHNSISLPKVIAGSSLNSAEELITLWGSHGPSRGQKLKEHPIQYKIIAESIYQLEYFYKYAMRLHEGYTEKDGKKEQYLEIAKSYAEMYNIFYDIYIANKKQVDSHLKEFSGDIVYKTICEYTGH